MGETLCKRTATVKFWDGYAPWYKALDIGAENCVLSLALSDIGCNVTVMEPLVEQGCKEFVILDF